jgi:hypothetical protein
MDVLKRRTAALSLPKLRRDCHDFSAERRQLFRILGVFSAKASDNLSGVSQPLRKLSQIGFGFGDRRHASAPCFYDRTEKYISYSARSKKSVSANVTSFVTAQ